MDSQFNESSIPSVNKIKEALYRAGQQALDEANYERAIERFEQLLERDPNYKDVSTLLEQARTQVLEQQKSKQYEQGRASLGRGNWEEAIVQFEALIKLDPNYRNARFLWRQAKVRQSIAQNRWLLGGVAILILLGLCGLVALGGGWFSFTPGVSGTPAVTEAALMTDTAQPVSPTARPNTATLTPLPPTATPTTPPDKPTLPPASPTEQTQSSPASTETIMPEPTLTPTLEPTLTPTETPEPILTPSETSAPVPSPTPTFTPIPLSGKIAVPVFQDGVYHLYLASADNNWTPERLFERASQPAFTHDGRGMVLRSWNHPDWAQRLIYLPDYRDITRFRPMTDFLEDAHPSLNDDNEFIFHSRRQGSPVIIKMGTYPGAEDNPNSQLILDEGENPDWLGDRIVYYAPFPYPGLYVMDAGGGEPTRILPTEGRVVSAAAPDGDRIAVSLNVNGHWQIFTMSVGQGADSLTQLTEAEADHYLPAWSPDPQGSHLAFASNRSGNWAIWVMAADGSNPTKLFDLPGPVDGTISVPDIDPTLSLGWGEERLAWAP